MGDKGDFSRPEEQQVPRPWEAGRGPAVLECLGLGQWEALRSEGLQPPLL